MNIQHPDLLNRLAADYVAGTMPYRARRRFAALAAAHPVIAEAVRSWERRLTPLTLSLPDQLPPPWVWKRIEAKLWANPAAEAEGPAATWWNKLAVWRGLTAFASVAALSLALLIAVPRESAPPRPGWVATLTSDQGQATFLVTLPSVGNEMSVRALNAAFLPPDKDFELWALPTDGPPRSIGLIPASGEGKLVLADRSSWKFKEIPAMAISLEPRGGSPTKVPTGPVLYQGKCFPV